MSEQITVDIDADGAVQVSVQGMKGRRCTDVTRQLEKALGTVKHDIKTAEFFQAPPGQQTVRR